MRKLVLFIYLLLIFQTVFSQSDFITIVRYDHLRVSPDKDSLAFRAVLVEEVHPKRARMYIFLLSALESSPVCLNPQIERFVFSPNGRLLSFVSPFGLYLMRLDRDMQTFQIISRKINDDWRFGLFDFGPDGNNLFVEIQFKNSKKEFYQIAMPKNLPDTKFISFLEFKKKRIENHIFENQTFIHYAGKILSRSFQHDDYFIGFVEDKSTQFPGDYSLIFSRNGKMKVLAKNCRPRILAPNADSSFFLVSFFAKNRNLSYILSVKSETLIPLTENFIISSAWLDSLRLVFLQNDGLFLFEIKSNEISALSDWRFPEWCSDIPLRNSKYQLTTGSLLKNSKADDLIKILDRFGFAPKIEFEEEGKSRIYFGEFPERSQANSLARRIANQFDGLKIIAIKNPFDLYNLIGGEEARFFADGIAKIQYEKNSYLSNRIIYVNEAGEFRVLFPSMNVIGN